MNIKTNSKYVKKNDIFICTHDEYDDRHKYINDITRASLIITDKDIYTESKIPIVKVNNTNDTLFEIYNKYYDYPLDNLNLIGITGTDGKTSTSVIIKNLLSNFVDTSYLGTLGFFYKDNFFKTKNTTPSIDKFLEYASFLKKENINNLVMEVSSEGLLHNRCSNLKFKRAIITNVTGDHLNVHKTFDNYLESKLKLFDLLSYDGIAIINTDDISYNYIKDKDISYLSYGFNSNADYRITDFKLLKDCTYFTLIHENNSYEIKSNLLGKFNIYNLVAAIACLNSLGIEIKDIIKYIEFLKPINGRLNVFKCKNNATLILDYAHTINATKEVLKFFNSVCEGKIITVVGSAGGRDKSKRSEIGKIVTNLSDKVIFTMDDPRYEKVRDIVNDLIKDVKKNNFIYIKNRKKAIKKAIDIADKNDIILVLGKGCDNYMAIKNKYKKYNDLWVIKKYI